MQCHPAASISSVVFAVAAAVRYVAGRGRFTLDRDEDPKRFGFWQGVWLAVAVVFAINGLLDLACL